LPESGQFIITKGNAPVIANIGQHQYMETSQQLIEIVTKLYHTPPDLLPIAILK